MASTEAATPKTNFDICAREFPKINSKTFADKSTLLNFVNLCKFICNPMSKIV